MTAFWALLASLVLSWAQTGIGSLTPQPVLAPPEGPVLWVRADGTIQHGISKLVIRWTDASGSGHDLLGRDGATEPVLDRLAHEGRPALCYDGNDVLERPLGMPTGDYTKVLALIPDEIAAGHLFTSPGGHALELLADGRLALSHAGGVFAQSDVALVAGQVSVVVATHDAATGVARIHVDGALAGVGATPLPNADPWLSVGGLFQAPSFRGRLVEVLLYDRVLDLGERAQLAHYLASEHVDIPRAPDVEFTRMPREAAVFPRRTLDLGDLEVEGVVHSPGYDAVVLEILRDGSFWPQDQQALVYEPSGTASFSLAGTVRAELLEFSMTVSLVSGGEETVVAERERLICGDIYLVQGQSNAEGFDLNNEGIAISWESTWVRTFGAKNPPELVPLDRHWDKARARAAFGHAAVGGWAVRMGTNLVTQYSVPVAILNGAEGAATIAQHQRNDANPTDIDTPYGRLLLRALDAGVDGDVRAIFWYQGEADVLFPDGYPANFDSLRSAWLQDFPGVEKIYGFQVRDGCGFRGLPGVREFQRIAGDLYPDVVPMSTNSVPGHDGCHYYAVGFQEIGDRISRVVARDLYGSTDVIDIAAPNVLSAQFTTPERIFLTFRNVADTIVADAGAAADFVLDDPNVSVNLLVTYGNNKLELRLTGPTTATKVSYVGHPGDGPWVENLRGVGALSFFDLPIGN